MKKLLLIISVISIFSIIVIPANAFEKGENRIANGTFETDKLGDNPLGWRIDEYG